MYIRTHSSTSNGKKQVVKIRKTEADSDSDGGEKHFLKTAQFSIIIALVRCMLFILSCSNEICIFIFILLVFRSKIYLCKCNVYFCKYTSLLTGVRLIKHRRESADLLIDF